MVGLNLENLSIELLRLHRLAGSIGPTRRVVLLEKGQSWFVTENAIVPTDTG